MVRLLFLIAFSFGSQVGVYGGDPKFPVSAIPEELKKDMNAVVREDHMVYTIINQGKGKMHSHYAITILNSRAKDHAHFSIGYDKLTKVTRISANMYDANGIHIKKIKNNEIIDESTYDGFTLYSDNRLKSIDASHGAYPYTIEIEYEKEYNFLFYIDGSAVGGAEKISVQNFSYKLIYPSTLAPRYKTYNVEVQPIKEVTPDGLESLTWTLSNILPLKSEPHADMEVFRRGIYPAPRQFDFDGYKGDMSNWNDFGKWIAELNKGRNNLPEQTKQTIQRLTANLATKEEKIKALYEYMQGKTRYVGIQLGIGGYQPFNAALVDEMGYGDCKALSNYMVTMLETVGINSHYALIHAGPERRKIDVGFPSSQFNHVIVAVPNENDTIWLECTSQTNPFGYQGTFTGDRQALLITNDGAKLVNTLRYPAETNVQSRRADVYLKPAGDATAKVRTTYSGLKYENDNLDDIATSQHDQQKKWVQSNTGIPSFDINDFGIKNNKGKIPSAVVTLDLSLKSYATVSGKRIFLSPNLMNKRSYVPEKVDNRKSKVVTRAAYTDIDTIMYHMPEGMYPEFLPEAVSIKSKFGEYDASFKVDGDGLLYIRRMKMVRGEFPPETYDELIEFNKNISKADKTKVVFLSKT
jgi:hypothetical protein